VRREGDRRIRNGDIRPRLECPAARIALHRDLDRRLLDEHTAAVELLKLLRPRWRCRSSSLTLPTRCTRSHVRERLVSGEEGFETRFVQEVQKPRRRDAAPKRGVAPDDTPG
jgi:hypothetical protein